MDIILNNFLINLLGVAIGRHSLLNRRILRHRQVLLWRLAIDRTTWREDDAFDVIFRHQLKQVNQAHQVITIVQQGLLHALTHSLWSCKMNDALNLRVLLEYTFQSIKITTVHLLEGRTDTCNLLNTIEDVLIRIRQIVDDDHLITCLLKFYCSMTSYEARTTCYQYCLFHF